MLVKKDPKLKYTDMAKWIDDNKNDSNLDTSKMYDYIVLLVYMLARRRKFFSKTDDYEMFCYFVANSVFMRLTTPRQYLDESDPDYMPPVKSVLNYLKKIVSGRKCTFMQNNFREISSPEIDDIQSEALRGYVLSGVNGYRSDLVQSEICIELSSVNKIILNELKEGTYGGDGVLCHKLHISILITLLKNFTLSSRNKDRLNRCVVSRKRDFDSLLSDILSEETLSAPTVYDLDSTYLPYVGFIANKVKLILANDVKEIVQEYELPDEMAVDMLLSERHTLEREEDG